MGLGLEWDGIGWGCHGYGIGVGMALGWDGDGIRMGVTLGWRRH